MGAARRKKRENMMALYRVTKKIKMKHPDLKVKDCINLGKEILTAEKVKKI